LAQDAQDVFFGGQGPQAMVNLLRLGFWSGLKMLDELA